MIHSSDIWRWGHKRAGPTNGFILNFWQNRTCVVPRVYYPTTVLTTNDDAVSDGDSELIFLFFRPAE